MRKLLFIIMGLTTSLNSFGQEPSEEIRFVFVDSMHNVITPDIWVKSKELNQNSLGIEVSKQYHLKIDSLPKFQINTVTFNNNKYTIYPLLNGHWLDTEYSIKLSYEGNVMNINLITLGFSIRDTIEFRKGDFIYLAKSFFTKKKFTYRI